MREGYYGKEPFDLRLTVLRFLRSLWKILALTLAGTLLFGGGYYVKNVLLSGPETYSATSVYKVQYVNPPRVSGDYYINEMTWNTFVQSQVFLEAVQEQLQEIEAELSADDFAREDRQPAFEELAGAVSAKLPSDLTVPTTTVIAASPERTKQLAMAVEKAMTEDFGEISPEVESISILTHGDQAEEVIPDVRPGRAVILSAILSFFFVTVLFLLKETGDDSIWLPASLNRRYGLKSLGTIENPVLSENLMYLCKDKKKVAVCPMDGRGDSAEVCRMILEKLCGQEAEALELIPMPAPVLCPESCEALREMDAVILAVPAGKHVGKPLEYVLDYLAQQDCPVTAALLWEADERLLKAYYALETVAGQI